ncbi:hypothetical protein SP60_07780 [Candidatus Thioglobus autotrophicus]|uniref:Rhodanese domain-containing protein n=1 Tax=Candidatus Thioglobus autotrophicus TaxID=1705394 RepID=A0A0M3TUK7_9GAMM|nr:rhodanese-like domain-containing protein [Candidatus Thioglobus autotrophicus]ALE53095.1 hypothetical protein SP60_07780 [Candidatus Thioglobus autotrophicus]WPE17220.1 rhodanese-like domain-containing protein [Candidatus Thioglobus autotrophicus]
MKVKTQKNGEAMMLKNKLLIFTTMLFAMVLQANASITIGTPLVSTYWLSDHKDKVIVLDVQKKIKKDMKTIAGAVLVDWSKVRAKKTEEGMGLIKMLPTKVEFNKHMQSLGVNNNSAIVITTSGDGASNIFLGTRLYWQLKYYGHDNVAMLDGGNAKWNNEKKAMGHGATLSKGSFVSTTERKELLATTSDVEKAVESGDTVLVDSREEDQYLGLFYKKKYVYKAGHIPGGKSAFGGTFLKHKGKTFQTKKNIADIFKAKGITTTGKGIAYCNSGHWGSGTWFIQHEILGNKNFKLYDGSMHAWTKGNKRLVNKIIYE